jgi:threonine dehydratase
MVNVSSCSTEKQGCVRDAQNFVARYLHHTPLWHSSTLSTLVGRPVFLKMELFQKTGSYKPRGMLWAIQNLSAISRRAGVVTFSAGNAGQGLAWAGMHLDTRTLVIMPSVANQLKIDATRGYGAEVLQHGTPMEAAARCAAIVREQGMTFISSYDDMDVMTGHASLGMEIIADMPDTTDIFLGIGGGGMAGGLVKALDETGSKARLFGVEPEGAAAMSASLIGGAAVQLEAVKTIADGLAAPGAGNSCFELVSRRFEAVLTVPDDAILEAMRLLMTRCKVMAEPAGAAAVAGLLQHARKRKLGDAVICIISGGNVDPSMLRQWL